jgi:hypothetical protein
MDGHALEPAAAAPSARSSELLGFPPDARVLIVNLDDFGMYHAVNVAVIRSIEEGIASSCSLMVPCPWALHAMHLLRQRPEIPFGIHLTLFCDTTHYRWGPLTARQKVSSLLSETGEPLTPAQVPQLLAQAHLDEVELDLTLALAREYGLAVRIWLEPGRRKLRQRGLPAGLSEWAVHPGLGNEESQAIDPGWRVRQTDYEFLTSREARELIQQEAIAVIDYSTIQQVWSPASAPR